MQLDRFYLNWRQQHDEYPRFSDRGGKEGVLSRFLREFEQFSAYAERALGARPKVRGLELTKIDQFLAGVSWVGLDDLALMLPWVQPFASASSSKQAAIAAQFREERAGGVLTVRVDVGSVLARLESRIVKPFEGELRAGFEAANEVLNDVFEKLIPLDQRTKRFQGANP
jgi:hypothetical protein